MSSILANPAAWLVDLFATASGSKRVTANEIISTAPAWYAVTKISGHVGQLPLNVHIRTPSGSEKAVSHPGYQLMRVRPNRYQTPSHFREMCQTHALLWGNARAYIVRDSMGRPVELIPLMPDRTDTVMVDGQKFHISQPLKDDPLNDNVLNLERLDDLRRTVVMSDSDVLHIPGLGFDGIKGKSLMSVASDSFTISIHADRRAAKQVQTGFGGRLMLNAPAGAFRNQDDANEFLNAFKEAHERGADSQAVGMLRDGMTADVLNMSNRDAQFLETRAQQRDEAALWFCIESILGDGQTSYNSLEMKNLAYLSNCLTRWLVKWEQECDSKLLTSQEHRNQTHYFKFATASLLRSDFQTTVVTLGNAISNRIINPNEAREKLEMNRYEGGDVFENPAISPGEPGASGQGATAPPASQARLLHMLKVEENRVNHFIEAGKSIEAIESWYSSWQVKLGDVIENELGGDRSAAVAHCQRSIDYLKPGRDSFDLTGADELILTEMNKGVADVV